MMKKILCLLCVFVVMFSCKQTQLTSNFNKRSKKIYVKPSLRNNDIEIALNEKKTPKHSKSISREVKDTFNYNDLKPKEEFIADAGISEIKVISNENKLHQKLTRIDTILKSNDSNLIEKEEILKLSNLGKKYSLIGTLYSCFSVISIPLNELFWGLRQYGFSSIAIVITQILLPFLAGAGLISLLLSIYFIRSSIKKIKKLGEKIKNQDSKIIKNIKVASLIYLLLIILPILTGIGVLIDILVNGFYLY